MAAGDVEGALGVVDAGDVGLWLSCLVVSRLSWFVGGQGSSWWWVLRGGDVVAGRCGGGGCGMKREGMSLFVTCVTFGSTFKRARYHVWIALALKFVVSIVYSVCYTIL